jgi:hypothetical protein
MEDEETYSFPTRGAEHDPEFEAIAELMSEAPDGGNFGTTPRWKPLTTRQDEKRQAGDVSRKALDTESWKSRDALKGVSGVSNPKRSSEQIGGGLKSYRTITGGPQEEIDWLYADELRDAVEQRFGSSLEDIEYVFSRAGTSLKPEDLKLREYIENALLTISERGVPMTDVARQLGWKVKDGECRRMTKALARARARMSDAEDVG